MCRVSGDWNSKDLASISFRSNKYWPIFKCNHHNTFTINANSSENTAWFLITEFFINEFTIFRMILLNGSDLT